MKQRMLVAAHDAGGAEVVSSWLVRNREKWDASYVLDGPAVSIFRRKLGARSSMAFSAELVDFVLCGSSGLTTLERSVVRAAREADTRCAVYLDHWKHYRQRFDVLPDEIWVCDNYAWKIAREEFPETLVVRRGNPYLEDFAKAVKDLTSDAEHLVATRARSLRTRAWRTDRILYVSEPGMFPEIEDRCRSWIALRAADARIALRFRPHPSEEGTDGYEARRDACAALPRVDIEEGGPSLAHDVAWAQTVLGADSMALAAALAAGRHVVSVLSSGEASLPFTEIERPYEAV